LKEIRALPILVSWGIWLIRNEVVFENHSSPLQKISQEVHGLFPFYKQISKLKAQRVLRNITINRDYPWGFYYRTFQWPDHIHSLGFVLYLLESHFCIGMANLWQGSNNQGEFKALFFLLKCAKDINLDMVHVFVDSFLTLY